MTQIEADLETRPTSRDGVSEIEEGTTQLTSTAVSLLSA